MADSEKKSSPPLPWIVLSGILGMFAVGTPAMNSINSPAATKSADKKDVANSDPIGWIDNNPVRPLIEFHTSQLEMPSAQDVLKDQLHGFDKEFMIVTVPDPIDSAFGFVFDQLIDATQRAIEKKNGYSLDRVWLPWELDRKNAKLPAKPDSDGKLPVHQTQPGILVFRRNANPNAGLKDPGLMIVFLVGESPLSGIHKRAFTYALQLMNFSEHPIDKPVRVVGPYFSGSQVSIEMTLKNWWEGYQSKGLAAGVHVPVAMIMKNPDYSFNFITGNASAFRKADFESIGPKGKVNFDAAIIPTKLTVNSILYYLSKRDRAMAEEVIYNGDPKTIPGKVAILTESNTGFGKQFSSFGKNGQGILVLRFPMHISQVKADLLKVFRKKDEATGLKANEFQIPSLLDEINADQYDGIPMQGGSTTSAANAQVMSTILTTISKMRCQYVGIVATDTRDKLFLVRLIREYCPDVHVFLTGGDVLFSHPDYRFHMRGVIIGSTYPLLPVNQFWTNANSGERVVFPSVGTEGYYNATLMQLGLNPDLLEYRPPNFALAGNNDIANSRPPIWISMVAPSGNLVPLQVFNNYEDSADYVKLFPNVDKELREKPISLGYPGALFPIGFCLMVIWLILLYRSWFLPSSPLSCYTLAHSGTLNSMPQMVYRNLILGSQIIFLAPVLTILGTHAEATQWSNPWDVPFLSVTAFCIVMMILAMVAPFPILGYHSFRRLGKGLPSLSLGIWLESSFWLLVNVLIVAGYLIFTFTYLNRFTYYTDSTYRTLFFVRCVDLGTGLSPLTPLFFLCLATSMWAYFQLKRRHLAERFAIPIPLPANEEPGKYHWFDRANRLEGLLKKEISETHFITRHTKATVLITILLASTATGLFFQSLNTMEGKIWDVLFFIGFCVVFALAASSLVHLYLLWTMVKRLLDAIAMIPMMRSFGRIPNKIVDVFGKYLYTQKPHLTHLQMPIHQLQILAEAIKNDPQAPASLQRIVERAPRLEQVFLSHFAQGRKRRDTELLARTIRTQLSELASVAMDALSDRWTNLNVDEAFGGGMEDYKASKPTEGEPAWVPLAEGFTATQFVVYLSQYFLQLRNMAWTVIISSSLLLIAATCYPFHPQQLLLYCLLALIAAAMGMVVYVFVQMNKDTVVSRISRTQPGKLSFDSGLIGSFMTYVLPAAGLLTAQLSGSFRTILEPLLRVLK